MKLGWLDARALGMKRAAARAARLFSMEGL